MTEHRRQVTNDTKGLMLLFIEPEGWDCWLMPGEAVEVRAEVESPSDDFEFHDNANGITVWPSLTMGIISVWQGSRELECGHQRPTS